MNPDLYNKGLSARQLAEYLVKHGVAATVGDGFALLELSVKGGPGSGHFDHAGRPGQQGGSLPGDRAMGIRVADKVVYLKVDEVSDADRLRGSASWYAERKQREERIKDAYARLTPAVQDALQRIGTVHGLDAIELAQRKEPMVVIRVDEIAPTGSMGIPALAWVSLVEVPAMAKATIGLHTTLDNKDVEWVVTHEMGHALDRILLRLSDKYPSDFVPNHLRQAYRDAVGNTDALKALRAVEVTQDDPDVVRGIVAGKEFLATKRYTEYLLGENEVWARAYTQYILNRSGAPTQMGMETYRGVPEQWTESDFAPVANAIDDIFTYLGWRR